MEKRKKPFSIRLIYWMTQIIFGLFVLIAVGSIALNIALHTGWLGENLQLHVRLPVQVSYTESGYFDVDFIDQEVRFVEAYGKMYLVDTDPLLAKWFGASLIAVSGILLFILFMFKNFITNVYHGIVFEAYNIRMLKKMAYGLIGLWFFTVLYSRVLYHTIVSNVIFEHLEVSSEFERHPQRNVCPG